MAIILKLISIWFLKITKEMSIHVYIYAKCLPFLSFWQSIPWNNLNYLTLFMRAFSFWFSSVQLLSSVWLFAIPWIAARQASLSITDSQSSLRFMSIESVMPFSHLILCLCHLIKNYLAGDPFSWKSEVTLKFNTISKVLAFFPNVPSSFAILVFKLNMSNNNSDFFSSLWKLRLGGFKSFD